MGEPFSCLTVTVSHSEARNGMSLSVQVNEYISEGKLNVLEKEVNQLINRQL